MCGNLHVCVHVSFQGKTGHLSSKLTALRIRNKELETYMKRVKQKPSSQVKMIRDEFKQKYEAMIRTLRLRVRESKEELRMQKKTRAETREATKLEQNLMSGAFYSLGMELMRLEHIDRMRKQTDGHSFLKRQREKLR